MTEVRLALVGAGRLGALHAQKCAQQPGARLLYVVDVNAARAQRVAAGAAAAILADYRELKGRVEAAIVAAPSLLHHEIARYLLEEGIDVLLEKPMAATVEQARDLAAVAERAGRILQIGHLERFNPAVVHARSLLSRPRFTECYRLSPFTERGIDVDVVLDLMVHDLDVVLSMTASEVVSVEALGVAVLTDRIDLANARLRFADGLIANFSASRVAARRERKIRFFQPDAYISLDYQARSISVYRKGEPPPDSRWPQIVVEQLEMGDADPLAEQLAAFVDSVRSRRRPPVDARDGLRVMEAIERIRKAVEVSTADTVGENPGVACG